MNLCFITARLLKNPEKLNISTQYITEVEINFPHARNYFANIIALAEGKVADTLLELYFQGDYILIEGELLVIEKQSKTINPVIYISDIQPASIITG
uniref:Putative single-stranded DNA binding protein n=1 Tax=Calliarthron tuberculosum TaxID=48942 RepID=M4IU81_CALTB|nr:putative single-stranded DNA binding protein [Calliarthron tuberculosum]AGA63893.1 putative single-stranded DNA binding protein [Calliarthron tuberculosum]